MRSIQRVLAGAVGAVLAWSVSLPGMVTAAPPPNDVLATQPVLAAGPGTPTLAALESWVRSTTPTSGAMASLSTSEQARSLVRCRAIRPTVTYCLHLGWITEGTNVLDLVDHQLSETTVGPSKQTGASTLASAIGSAARQSASARLAGELAEIREAFAMAAEVESDEARGAQIKQWLAAQAAGGTAASRRIRTRTTGSAIPMVPCESEPDCGPLPPSSYSIMSWASHGAEQIETYYCGPATTKMAANFKGVIKSQDTWFGKVRVWDNGVAQNYSDLVIMKNVLNAEGGYNTTNEKFTVYYFTPGTDDATDYFGRVVHRIFDEAAPAMSNVKLWDQYFPYLTQDFDGHFQIIRGYTTHWGGVFDPHIRIFEPFNEARWPQWYSNTVTSGPRDVTDNQLFNATIASHDRIAS